MASETSRIEAFSDGVYAIAITLLILDRAMLNAQMQLARCSPTKALIRVSQYRNADEKNTGKGTSFTRADLSYSRERL